MTLKEIRDSVLTYINRPSSELGTVVDLEINSTLLRLQRGHSFNVCENLLEVTYPGGNSTITLTLDEGVSLRNVIAVNQVSGSNFTPFERKSFGEVLGELKRNVDNSTAYSSNSEATEGRLNYRNTSEQTTFFVMGGRVGLFPFPASDVNLLLYVSLFLPALVNDGDSNVLTENCADYIVLATLRQLHILMKSEVRYAVTDNEVKLAYEALLEWDRDLSSGLNFAT